MTTRAFVGTDPTDEPITSGVARYSLRNKWVPAPSQAEVIAA